MTAVHESLRPYEDRVDLGLIRKVVNLAGDLVLYNYTDQCTYEKVWDEYTRQARGIIFEVETGECIARPFPKFFNLGEQPETRLENLPTSGYEIHEKLDGSLGILYYWDGKWNVATRGSFSSDQALYAQEKILPKYDLSCLATIVTYLVEIIYPENRIVLNYGSRESLVLLGAIDYSGREYPRDYMVTISLNTGMELSKPYSISLLAAVELGKALPGDLEGFVLHWPETGLRVKIKGEEYLRLHRIICGMSPLAFWEVMDSNGRVPLDYLQQIPEEFRPRWESIVQTLEEQYSALLGRALDDIRHLPSVTDFRAVGIYLKQDAGSTIKYPKTVFPFLRKGVAGIHDLLKEMIRPHGNQLQEIS